MIRLYRYVLKLLLDVGMSKELVWEGERSELGELSELNGEPLSPFPAFTSLQIQPSFPFSLQTITIQTLTFSRTHLYCSQRPCSSRSSYPPARPGLSPSPSLLSWSSASLEIGVSAGTRSHSVGPRAAGRGGGQNSGV